MREIIILNNKELRDAFKTVKKSVFLLEVEEKKPVDLFLSVEDKFRKEIKDLKKQLSNKKSANQGFKQKLSSV